MNTKEEFINVLQECLEETISREELADTLNYYREYFMEEMGNGKTEEEILKSLGNPRLIAQSIQDVHEEADQDSSGYHGYYDMEDDTYHEEGEMTTRDKVNYVATRAGIVVGIIALLVVVALLLHAFMPLILVGIVVYGISRILRG